MPNRSVRASGPLRILWAARWEHDKNPETFFAAMEELKSRKVQFRVSVIGQQFRDSPAVFERMRKVFADHIDRWGYQPTHDDYLAALREADVFVSTAIHEFFGIAAVESIAAGAYPLLPERLAYPELLDLQRNPQLREACFYDGSVTMLAKRLEQLAGDQSLFDSLKCREVVNRFHWAERATEMDTAIDALGCTSVTHDSQ